MANSPVRIERSEAVSIITLDRPSAHNALNEETIRILVRAVEDAEADRSVRAVVITGSGERSFCAGADLDELSGLSFERASEVLSAGQDAMSVIAGCSVPVIAAVNGLALGGGFELALACTFPILSKNASLGLPETGLGLIPGYGGTQRLPRIVGRAVAAHAILTGERITAERAFDLGLTPLTPVEPAELLDIALGVARRIAEKGPVATTAVLTALCTGAAKKENLALETMLAARAASGAESAEGISAFKERRAPRYIDRPEAEEAR